VQGKIKNNRNRLSVILSFLFCFFSVVMAKAAAEVAQRPVSSGGGATVLPVAIPPEQFFAWVSGGVFLVLLFLFSFWLWNRKLRSLVSRRTQDLVEAEDMKQAILDASPVGIGMVGKHNHLGWHNRAMTEMLGYESDELKGCDVQVLYGDEKSCRLAGRDIKAVLESGLNIPIEAVWRKKDGSFFDCRFRFAPFHTSEYRGIVTAVDISENKRVEREVIASERRLKAILESSPNPIVVYNDSGFPTYINPAFTSVFGWSFSEIEGNVIPYVPQDQMAITVVKIKELRKYGKSLSFETQRFNKAGETLDILVNAATIKSVDSEEVASIVINLTDLTDNKRLKKRLLQAEKMELVGTLAGGIAHDFNNILTAINGFSEIGEYKARQNQATLKEHQQVQVAAERARDLVSQLLTFSRKSEPVSKQIDLENMVTDSLSMIERVIPRMIGVKFEPGGHGGYLINGDINQLNQIMLNLCLNAADAMPDGGTLTIRIEAVKVAGERCSACQSLFTGEYVKLQIMDTGSGIDEASVQDIFAPFYTTKDIGKGTGLGLATVFGIVNSHGGHIICQSKLAQGTTFDLFFPLAVPETSSAVPEIPIEDETSAANVTATVDGDRKTILVVDDEEIIREFVAESMVFYGYRTIPAANGEEALQLYQESGSCIDLVLLDISMPGMGGFHCLEKLLEIDSEVKVIMASGYFPDGLKNDPVKKGARGFLNKPFKVEVLLETIRSLLD